MLGWGKGTPRWPESRADFKRGLSLAACEAHVESSRIRFLDSAIRWTVVSFNEIKSSSMHEKTPNITDP